MRDVGASIEPELARRVAEPRPVAHIEHPERGFTFFTRKQVIVDAVADVPPEAQIEDFRCEIREARASAGLRRLQRARRPDDVGTAAAAASAALIVRSSRILFILYRRLAGSIVGIFRIIRIRIWILRWIIRCLLRLLRGCQIPGCAFRV